MFASKIKTWMFLGLAWLNFEKFLGTQSTAIMSLAFHLLRASTLLEGEKICLTRELETASSVGCFITGQGCKSENNAGAGR